MDVKIGTFTEIRKIHSYNRLLEQSVLSLAEGRLGWEEFTIGLQEKRLKSASKTKYLHIHEAVYKDIFLQNRVFSL